MAETITRKTSYLTNVQETSTTSTKTVNHKKLLLKMLVVHSALSTSFIEMLISFNWSFWHLPALTKVPIPAIIPVVS